MKRKILFLILFISLIFLYNTSLYATDINFGFKGSINASYFHGDYVYTGEIITLDPGPKLSTRFSAGGLVRYNFTDVTSLQTEILYTTRGVRFRETFEFRNQTLFLNGDLTLTYVELPVLLRFTTSLPDRGPTFVQEPGFTYNAYAGTSFAYKTNATFSGRLTGDIFGDDFRQRFENRIWDQFTGTDISFIIGAGLEYGIRYRFTFDVRYVLSITNIGNDSQFPEDIRNGMVSVFIGTVF
jgi:hypothetical protein